MSIHSQDPHRVRDEKLGRCDQCGATGRRVQRDQIFRRRYLCERCAIPPDSLIRRLLAD